MYLLENGEPPGAANDAAAAQLPLFQDGTRCYSVTGRFQRPLDHWS
jgi:hypothetical protein